MNDTTLQHIRHEIYACFERKWPSVYEALEDGRINVEQFTPLHKNRYGILFCYVLLHNIRYGIDNKVPLLNVRKPNR